MILAPVDSREFSRSRHAEANPWACRLAPLVRLMLVAVLAGALIFVALEPESPRSVDDGDHRLLMALASQG